MKQRFIIARFADGGKREYYNVFADNFVTNLESASRFAEYSTCEMYLSTFATGPLGSSTFMFAIQRVYTTKSD